MFKADATVGALILSLAVLPWLESVSHLTDSPFVNSKVGTDNIEQRTRLRNSIPRPQGTLKERTCLLRLRGGKGPGRRTQPKKVSREFWRKTYSASWDKLPIRKVKYDPIQGRSAIESEKADPGNFWATGHRSLDHAPGLTLGRELPYEMSYLKRESLLFHPDTMEPMNPKRIFMDDEEDPWQELRWDPRDLDEEVTRRMLNATEEHPALRMEAEESIAQDEGRAAAFGEAVRWLAGQEKAENRHRKSAQRRGRKSGANEERGVVLSAKRGNFSEAVVAAAHRSAGAGGAMMEVRCEAGRYSWEGENVLALLGVKRGRFAVLGDALWDPAVSVGEGGEGGGGVELRGCWWLAEETGGRVERVRLAHRQMQVEDADLENDPLSCVTVCGGNWTLERCSVFGGGREVVSARWHAEVALRGCVLGDVPAEGGAVEPMAAAPRYAMEDPVYNRTLPLRGVARFVDGVMAFDAARVCASESVFADSLAGGAAAMDSAALVLSNCSFAVMGAGVLAADAARVAVDSALFSWLGAAVHNSATMVLRGNCFAECVDGALFAGEGEGQRVELRGNVVQCAPHDGVGYAWLSLRRPGKLIDKGNVVENDPYYPDSLDVVEATGMPWDKLQTYVWEQIEKELGPQPEPESRLLKNLQAHATLAALQKAKRAPDRRKSAEELDQPDGLASAPFAL